MFLCPVDDKGVMTEEAAGFEGLFYDKANKANYGKIRRSRRIIKTLRLLLTLIHMTGERRNQLFSVQLHNGLRQLKISVKIY